MLIALAIIRGEASLAIAECVAEKKLTERQLLQRWCQALMGYIPDGNAYDLVALLKRTINEYKRVTVFVNPQHLCKKEHGRYCSIQGPIETIRRIWDETDAPMVFCCNENFVDAINGNDEDSRDIGNSFRWRSGGFVDLD